MSPSVAIIDYGVGNLTSVANAVSRLQVEVRISADPLELKNATHIILPGVGSFGEGMKGLAERGFIPALQEEVRTKKKPLLGICLGMQLLATEGFEHGHHQGLGFIPGSVRMIDTTQSGLRLPHIGWNDVAVSDRHPIARGFTHMPIFYFVHSFHLVPEQADVIAGTCEYGERIVALVQSANVCGAQFHPEKSHDDGLRIFQNFLALSSC
ncbi:MAG: imidazole glycerol phosphate synthase subunit HisH [Candidatus Peribacter sp.]|nr:imidazole glycerol phosphate synthase subunit HisH [Candidatus Peribacter sp.]